MTMLNSDSTGRYYTQFVPTKNRHKIFRVCRTMYDLFKHVVNCDELYFSCFLNSVMENNTTFRIIDISVSKQSSFQLLNIFCYLANIYENLMNDPFR